MIGREGQRRGEVMRPLCEEVEEIGSAPPVIGLRILQAGVDNLERARQGDAQAAGDPGKPRAGLVAVRGIERGMPRQLVDDRLQRDIWSMRPNAWMHSCSPW